MRNRGFGKFVLATMIAGAIFLSSTAHAIPMLESMFNVTAAKGFAQDLATATDTVYQDEQGNSQNLIFDKNVPPDPECSGCVNGTLEDIATINALVLGLTQLDPLAKMENVDSGNIGASSTTESLNSAIPDSAPLAFTITCVDTDCAEFNWAFIQANTTLAVEWNVVKIGVKYGGGVNAGRGSVFFLIDPFGTETDDGAGIGADSGNFNFNNYADEEDAGGNLLLASWFDTSGTDPVFDAGGLSNIVFFGAPESSSVPEPGMLALFGASLVGLGLMRRRRKAT